MIPAPPGYLRAAREICDEAGALLVLDEVQKIPRWSETVKRLWDGDSRAHRPLKVVLLGSAPLLMQQGLTESLEIAILASSLGILISLPIGLAAARNLMPAWVT